MTSAEIKLDSVGKRKETEVTQYIKQVRKGINRVNASEAKTDRTGR